MVAALVEQMAHRREPQTVYQKERVKETYSAVRWVDVLEWKLELTKADYLVQKMVASMVVVRVDTKVLQWAGLSVVQLAA
jgi:hypothetical protein